MSEFQDFSRQIICGFDGHVCDCLDCVTDFPLCIEWAVDGVSFVDVCPRFVLSKELEF